MKLVTFFMIVTNYDVLMADYAIRSYRWIYDRNDTPWSGDNFVLFVYANCLNKSNRDRYFPVWRQIPYVELYDNTERARTMHLKAGDSIVSPEGVRRERDSSCEHYDELWTRELTKIDTPYHATVDADFEILDEEFYVAMMQDLERDERLIAYSCQYDPERVVHDSYSDETILLGERWHTCFCVYKKAASLCTVSHFYYETKLPSGRRYCYDSAGNFQQHLIHTHGWKLKALGPQYSDHFIHYGAFSKNRSISPRTVGLYRRLAIAAQTGRLPGLPRPRRDTKAAGFIRQLSGRSLVALFGRHMAERGRYSFDEPAYDGGVQAASEHASSAADVR